MPLADSGRSTEREPGDESPQWAIELSDVTRRFNADGPPAVDRLSISIRTGELAVFVGPSGCGKTTTLRMINRLDEPTSGSVRVLGVEVGSRPVHELRREIGYVIQQVGLFPHRTIADNIATVPSLLGWRKSRIADRVADLAELVDLDEAMLRRYPAELSGGQQQRVGVARALAADPPILLMDEPYSAVDPIVRARLQDDLIDLHRRLGTTIVLVTHDIDEALKVGDRVAVFGAGGRLEQFATPLDLLARPANESVSRFLGADRHLRRLALITIGDIDLGPVDPTATVCVDANANARHAVDQMVAKGVDRVGVSRDGSVVGTLELSSLTRSTTVTPS